MTLALTTKTLQWVGPDGVSGFAAEHARPPTQLEVVAVGRATTAKDAAQVPQKSPQALGLVRRGRSDGCAGRDVLSDLVQRDVQIFSSWAVEPQNDVIPHAQTLIAPLAAPVGHGRVLPLVGSPMSRGAASGITGVESRRGG